MRPYILVGLSVATLTLVGCWGGQSGKGQSEKGSGSVTDLREAAVASAALLNPGEATALAPSTGTTTPAPIGGGPAGSRSARALQAYRATIADHPKLTYEELLQTLSQRRESLPKLSFEPKTADYYRLVTNKLALTAVERDKLDTQGVVQLDNRDGLSMAQQYLAIYVNDLPVLITTDSILDALHRSYDKLLETLERSVFLPLVGDTLKRAHATGERAAEPQDPVLKQARCDASLYLSVALELLAGRGVEDRPVDSASRFNVKPLCNQAVQRERILASVAGLQMQLPGGSCTTLYGSERCVDFSQFRPRGHYDGKPELEAYFRAMMWLGREDTGLRLTRAGQGGTLSANPEREASAATMLSFWLAESGGIERLTAMDRALSILVDQGEFLGPAQVCAALKQQGIEAPAPAIALGRSLPTLLANASPARAIRSQIATPNGSAPESAPYEATFQLFGQRFLIDSMVLSKVVYDSTKTERLFPSSLDVMAALGNSDAIPLLQVELTNWRYEPQLLASRRAVEAFYADPPQSFHHRWLSALQVLHHVSDKPGLPQVMKTEAWRRKVLQTQAAAWAQIRRDNILYAAQSYSAMALCDYPKAYVEPYPEFYRQLADLLQTMGTAVQEVEVAVRSDDTRARFAPLTQVAAGVRQYIARARELLLKLETLASKELDGRPFSAAEQSFLRSAIQTKFESLGCTSRVLYTGWYTELAYASKPIQFEPVIADVHSTQAGILEQAVGHNELLVAAMDNGSDRAVYVGPTYTHYEFVSANRLTDAQWKQQLTSKPPARPSWIAPLVGPAPTPKTRRPRLVLREE